MSLVRTQPPPTDGVSSSAGRARDLSELGHLVKIMTFTYQIIWTDPQTMRQGKLDMKEPNIALFIARKRVLEGKVNVYMNVIGRPDAEAKADDDVVEGQEGA